MLYVISNYRFYDERLLGSFDALEDAVDHARRNCRFHGIEGFESIDVIALNPDGNVVFLWSQNSDG